MWRGHRIGVDMDPTNQRPYESTPLTGLRGTRCLVSKNTTSPMANADPISERSQHTDRPKYTTMKRCASIRVSAYQSNCPSGKTYPAWRRMWKI